MQRRGSLLVEHEEWADMLHGVLRGILTGKVCTTSQCFGYETDPHCRPLLVRATSTELVSRRASASPKGAGTGRGIWEKDRLLPEVA